MFLLAIFILMMSSRLVGHSVSDIPAGDDLVSWCMVATSFLGLAHVRVTDEMIRVGLADRPLREARTAPLCSKSVRLLSSASASSAFFAYYARAADLRFLALPRHGAGRRLPVPLWISAARLFAAAWCILLIAFIDELIHVLARQSAALREADAQDRRGGGRASHSERVSEMMELVSIVAHCC